jgi:DNA-binding NtrC family response regulator
VREHALEKRGPPRPAQAQPASHATPALPAPDPLVADRPTLDELNRRYAERMLKELGGNKTKAAEALGIDRKTLSRLLREE